ncbi:ribosomal protection-like ABC-F family protein [Heyndrickxia vini]|uniref:ABC-F type ribosomal protection protein n=1 Tax=Heyndrickxia vini TaxID=1476025 RepID=A0ABX7E0R5_9BACI|nr:ABC-F type ribosomal protection protein [Heyndrickxia vini]QQZ08860.1 ABC-F type ribosomal protection protein [Heyndrickxia vini]
MIICSVNKINKSYGGNAIFEDVSFEIKEKDRVGLVGRNGCGKTTLMKLLSSIETADTGQIHWKKGYEIGYLSQIPDNQHEQTVREVLKTSFQSLVEIEMKMKSFEEKMAQESRDSDIQKYGDLQDQFIREGGYEMEANLERVANGLQITSLLPQKFSDISGGEKTKVGLGKILLKNPDLLLLDEPTNHLDLQAIEWLGDYLKDYPGTVVVISHDRYFLDEIVNRIIDLEDGEVHLYKTNFSGFVKEKEERLLQEFQAYQEQQKKIKKMKEAIKRLKEWANRANPPNEGLHKRARNMERALERMEKINRPILERKKINVDFEAVHRSGKDVVKLEEVSKSFSEKHLFHQVNMHIQYLDRVAIIGENGTGKSTLLKIMLGQITPDSGNVTLGSNLKIGYLSQQAFNQSTDTSVIDTFRNEISVTEGEARHILAKFLFYGHSVFRKVNQLSGGERMRLRLAQLMYQDINFLILDEPTNHLDIDSREVLEEALDEFNGTILAVTHDRYFLNRLFKKIYWIENRVVHMFNGDYNWAKGKMNELRQRSMLPVKVEKKPKKKEEKVSTKVLEVDIETIESQLEELLKQIESTIKLDQLQELYMQQRTLESQREDMYGKLAQIIEGD